MPIDFIDPVVFSITMQSFTFKLKVMMAQWVVLQLEAVKLGCIARTCTMSTNVCMFVTLQLTAIPFMLGIPTLCLVVLG